jgi:PAS domain S-box-containing protein
MDNILLSVLKDERVETVAVRLGSTEQSVRAITRDEQWAPVFINHYRFTNGPLCQVRPIVFSGNELGAVQVRISDKFLGARMSAGWKWVFGVVAGLDVLLILALQQILWRVVLKPLKNIERYTAAVCAGDVPKAPDHSRKYRGELERVREATEQMVAMLDARYQALSRNRFMLECILNSVPQAVFWKDRDGVFLGCNGVFARAAGVENRSEIVGKTDFDLPWTVAESSAFRQDDLEVMKTLAPKTHIAETVRQADGKPIWIDTRKMPLLDEQGKVYGVLGVFEDVTERKQSEEALRAAHDRLLDIIEFLPDPTFVINHEGKVIAWNRAMELLVNLPKDKILGSSDYSLAIYGVKKRILIDFLNAPVGEQAAEYKYIRRVGEKIFAEAYLVPANHNKGAHLWGVAAPLYNQTGDRWGSIEVIRDVTERVEASERLRESERRLSLAFSATADAIWEWNLTTRTSFFSARWYEMMGYKDQEFVMNMAAWKRLCHPSDIDETLARIHHAVTSKEGVGEAVFRMRHQNGSWIWILGRGKVVERDAVGAPVLLCGTNEDITERKRAENALRSVVTGTARTVGQEFFRSLARHVADALSVKYALVGELLDGTSRLRTLAAWASGLQDNFEFELAGTPSRQALDQDGCFCQRNVQRLFPHDLILVKMSAEGYCGIPMLDSSGRPMGILAVADDKPLIEPEERARALLSIFAARAGAELERLRVENSLRKHEENLQGLVRERTAELMESKERAEKANRAKSLFLSSMSHELRTPLNAILGFAQVMAREMDVTLKQRENLGVILKSGEHLLAIINDILDLAKIESGKVGLELSEFDLGDLTSDLITMLRVQAEAKGLELILDQSSSFPRFVRTDPAKLRQIIINLAGNAIKFTRQGRVSIKLGVQALDAADHKKRLVFSVSDTGIGIPSSDLERIFQPFVQLAQNEGTGLGLAITQQYIQLLGGSISVVSELGKGSTFTFTIAYEPVDLAKVPVKPSKSGNIVGFENADSIRILVVEDQFENRLLLNKLLSPRGFQIMEACDGQEGVQACASWRPHAVFMDRRMPILDGLSATRAIRQLPDNRDIIIIAVTAHAFREERQEMLDAGCNDFLAKPFSDKQLFEMLEKHLPLRAIRSGQLLKVAPSTAPKSDRNAMERLPEKLRWELKDALERSDMKAIDGLIEAVGRENPGLATVFQQYAERFDYAALIELIK